MAPGFLAGYRGAVILVTHDLPARGVCRSHRRGRGRPYRRIQRQLWRLLDSTGRTRPTREGGDAARRDLGSRSGLGLSKSRRAEHQATRPAKRLDDLREERPLLKEQTLSIDLRTGFRGGQSMIELVEASGTHGVPLFEALTTSIQAKSCVGVLGPNGGKSTLFKLIAKSLSLSRATFTGLPDSSSR